MPVGVLAFDQVDLPLPVPALQLLLAQDRAFHVAEKFVADEPMDLVAAGKAFDAAVPVLPEPAEKVAGDPDVKSAVGLTGKNVDARVSLLSHTSENAARWMLKQVQHDEIYG
jgi:hypothetical protein